MLPALGKTLQAAAGFFRSLVRYVEEWAFDTSRGVQTAGNVHLRDAGHLLGDASDSVNYIPARVANVRAALRDLPLENHSAYTFVDLGSGKGRTLFVAAEYPFHRILGVEFSTTLYTQAQENVRRFSHRKQRCLTIEPVLADAAEYHFPPGNLVIYLFNPFGAATMKRVQANLAQSLEASPRHVVLLLLWPENAGLVARMPSMRLSRATRRYQIYETRP
jgi:SAM-dependent methyltransferase